MGEPLQKEPICLDSLPEQHAVKPVGTAYKVTATLVSAAVTIGAIQNLDTLNRWEDTQTDNFYPTAPPQCRDVVNPNIDLSQELPKPMPILLPQPNIQTVFAAPAKKQPFFADVSDVRSRTEKFTPAGINVAESWRQAREFFDHRIESFTLSSGLTITIYSTTDTPSFTINPTRFDELFHASLDPNISIGDAYYRQFVTCMQQKSDLPNKLSDRSLDVLILPEPHYCIANARIQYVPPHADSDCIANSAAPPHMLLEYLWWSPLDEEVMILSVDTGSDLATATKSINRMLVHEAVHYMKNNMGGKVQLGPEERFAEMLEATIYQQDIANAATGTPAISYVP